MSCSPMSVECWWSFRSIRRDSFARCATPGTRESCGQAVSHRKGGGRTVGAEGSSVGSAAGRELIDGVHDELHLRVFHRSCVQQAKSSRLVETDREDCADLRSWRPSTWAVSCPCLASQPWGCPARPGSSDLGRCRRCPASAWRSSACSRLPPPPPGNRRATRG